MKTKKAILKRLKELRLEKKKSKKKNGNYPKVGNRVFFRDFSKVKLKYLDILDK